MAAGEGERRVVTILFADLVGSTALAERLDPEEVKLVVGEAIGRLIALVETYGGHVKDLAGDGLLALFGAPQAHEDDPERATRAGLEMTRSISDYADEVRRGWGIEGMSVRVGIHTGEVVVGEVGGGSRLEYGAVGDAVNVAARLQSSAGPGNVIVTADTRRLVLDRFEWGPAMQLELKGKSQPLEAYLAVGLASSEAQRREPAAVATPLVGRGSELKILAEVAAGISAGRGGILAIVGEPGIGKSRMAAELRRAVDSGGGVRWLEGRCVSYGEALPYWPFRDLLRHWLGLGPQDPEVRARVTLMRRLEELFAEEAAEVFPYLAGILGLRLDGEAGRRLTDVSPESVQYRSFEVCLDLLARLSVGEPQVLFIDDLHWCDPTSLALTERLLHLVEDHAVLLVFSMRPETDHPAWALKERAAREFRHLYRELSLSPLDGAAETELLAALAGDGPLPEAEAARILEFSAGNAFYLEEIVRAMRDGEAGEGAQLNIPRTIEGVLLARIDRLDPAWREVLTAASVLGRSFSLDLLSAVAGLERAAVREALHHLLRLDLLQDDRRGADAAYRFKHALIQDAAYRTLLSARRAEMHRRAADWLTDFYADRPERAYGLLAHHWLAANDNQRAARYLRLAGDRALGEWALDEAAEHYRALLPLLREQGAEDSAEILFQLGATLHLGMRYAEANEVWAEAFTRWRYPEPPAGEATAGLVVATNQLPWTTDPGQGSYATNQSLFQQTWDRLVEGRPGLYVVPGLADRWDVSHDGRVYRFHLREGLVWNDGAPITSADVVFALRRIVNPAALSTDATMMFVVENAEARSRGELPEEAVGVEAIDDRTVEIRLTRPYPTFLFNGTYPEFSAMREDLALSGAFALESMGEESVVVARDAGYPRRRGGNVRRIEWRLLRDPDDLTRALRDDQVDAVWGNARMTETPGDLGLAVNNPPATMTTYVAFVGSGKWTPDIHLRRALALSLDLDRSVPVLPINRVAAHGGLVPPGVPGHTPDIALAFDPDGARRELGQSDHSGPVVVAIAVEQLNPHVEWVLEQWRGVLGLEVDLFAEPMAANTVWGERAHAAFWNWVAHAPTPEYFLRNLLHSKSYTRLTTRTIPGLDDLLDSAIAADGRAQWDLYHRADRLVVREECEIIPLAYGGVNWFTKKWVHGIWQWGAPWQSWDELVIDEDSPRYGG